MADYFLSERAARDIEEIADYGFTNFGVIKSREYGQSLKDCLNDLANSPLMGLGADELADGVGCELVFKPLLGADTNHGSAFPNDNRPSERSFAP